jgi:hypothetical protein
MLDIVGVAFATSPSGARQWIYFGASDGNLAARTVSVLVYAGPVGMGSVFPFLDEIIRGLG